MVMQLLGKVTSRDKAVSVQDLVQKLLRFFIGTENLDSAVVKPISEIASSRISEPNNYVSQPIKGAVRLQRIRNIYNPLATEPFKISRSKLELFIRCNRCFYIDRRLGVGHPDSLSFSLNLAVDELLKKEFDTYRTEQKSHPLCMENNINVIPFKHANLESWRKSLHEGVQYVMPNTNFLIQGGIDDVWINPETEELIIVDYKATSKKGDVDLNADWQICYKRQAEIYQWLFRKNGFKVSSVAYFVYCNAKKIFLALISSYISMYH